MSDKINEIKDEEKLPKAEVKVVSQDREAEYMKEARETSGDFGKLLMLENLSTEGIRNSFGGDLKLQDKDDYWKSQEVQDKFTDKFGTEGAKDKFDLFYKNLQGEYARYQQDSFDSDAANRAFAGTGFTRVNKKLRDAGAVQYRSVAKLSNGGFEHNGEIYGIKNSNRENATKTFTLFDEDEDGNMVGEDFDMTPAVIEEMEEMEGFDGYAYDYETLGADEFHRGKLGVQAIFNGKVWDKKKNKFVDVRSDQIVSNWDLPSDSILSNMLKGNDLAMDGIEYAKILLRSPLNTAIEFLDIIPQVGRGVIAMRQGDDAEDNELYQKLTSWGIQLKAHKTSMSDEAMKDGFFGSAEVFLGTVADVASQLMVGGMMGKMSAKAVGGYSKAVGSVGLSGASMRAAGSAGAISQFSTRLSLTMMAAKDMYQETLEHGFTKREAGFAMSAAIFGMWKANSFSSHLIEGVEPNALKYYAKDWAKRTAKSMYGNGSKAIAKGGTEAGARKMMTIASDAAKGLNSWTKKAREFSMKNDMWFSSVEEMTEEILEELSSEAVRQMMNGYKAFIGNDLATLKVGEGRFKSYWDKGYWDGLAENLIISGIGGAMGGPIGKMMHGGLKTSSLSDASTISDFVLAGGTDVLRTAVIDASQEYMYAPKDMTTEFDETVKSFISGGTGKNMNEVARDALLQDIAIIDTFVNDMGLSSVKSMIDQDPELKEQLDNTSILADTKNIATKIQTILGETGISTDALKAMEDGDMDEALVIAGESSSVHRKVLIQQSEKLKLKIEELTEAKKVLEGKVDTEEKGEEKDDKKKGGDKEMSTELDEDIKALKEENNKQKKIIAELESGVDRGKLTELRKLNIKARGLVNGSAAEVYYLQHTLYDDAVFGAVHNRDPEFARHGKDFFANVYNSTRDSMYNQNMEKAEIVKKAQENAKKISAMSVDNVLDYQELLNGTPYMSAESTKIIAEVRDQLVEQDTTLNDAVEYAKSDAYINDVISTAIAKYDNIEFKPETIDNPDGTTETVQVAEDGMTTDLLKFMATAEFKNYIKTISVQAVEGTEMTGDINLTYINLKNLPRAAAALRSANRDPGYKTAVFVEGEFDPASDDRKEAYLEGMFDLNMNSYFQDGSAVDAMGKEGLIAIGQITEVEKEPSAVEAVKKFKKIVEGDPRLAFVKNLYKHVTDGKEDSVDIKNLEHIDPEMPKGLDPFNMDWMIQSITETPDGEFKTKKGNVIDKVKELSYDIHVSEDGKKFHLDANQTLRLKELQHATKIRIAQKRVLGQIVGGVHPMGGNMIDKVANFRDNIDRIVGKAPYPNSSNFSQEDVHSYKDNTVFSDFVNDFVFDAREVSRVLKKADDNLPLTDDEKTLVVDYKNFLLVLAPRTEMANAKEEDIDTEIVTDIRTASELASAQRFMEKTFSLEQAEEILLGLEYLASEQGFNPDQEESTEFLKQRQTGIKSKMLDYKGATQLLRGLADNLRGNGETVPVELEAFLMYLEGFETKDLVTDKDFLEAENMLKDFLSILPAARKLISDEQFNELTKLRQDNTPQEFYVYSGGFDINEFNKYYKELLEENGVTGDIPTYEQEKVASMVVAFLGTEGPVHTSEGGATNTLYIDGVAGSGKSKLVSGIALKIAQRMMEGDKNKVMYASNHQIQIDNLKEGLGDVVTSGEGKDLKGVFNILTEYVNSPSNKDIQKEIDESMVIIYDEATLIDARKRGTDGKHSIHNLLDLIQKVNKVRESKGINPIKLILMGDSKQSGFKVKGESMVSNLSAILNGYGAVKPDPLTYSFRVNNRYLREGLTSTLGSSRKAVKGITYYFGHQPDYNNILTGIQPVFSTNQDFNEVLDSELAKNIREQIKHDPKFTVGISPDSGTSITSPDFLQLMTDFPNNVKVVETNLIQGSEFNYVITEFTNDYIGNYKTGASKSEMEKDMYTLLSRGKDFVRVFIKNDLPVKAFKEDNQLVLESKIKFDNNKGLIYGYLMQLYADVQSTTPKKGTVTNQNKESNPCSLGKGGKFGAFCLLQGMELDKELAISKSMAEAEMNSSKKVLITLEQDELVNAKLILEAYTSLLSQPPNTIKELLYDADRLDKSNFSDVGKNWIRNNVKEIEILIEELHNKEIKERDDIISIVNDAALGAVANLKNTAELDDDASKLKFAEDIINTLISENPGINFSSQFVFDLLQQQLTAKIEFVNKSKGVIKNEDTSIISSFRKSLEKFKGYEGYLGRIKVLEDKIDKRQNTDEELIEYEELTEGMMYAKNNDIIQDSYIEPLVVNENGLNGSLIDESSDYVGELSKSYVYNAKMNQPKEFGGMGRIRLNSLTNSQEDYIRKNVLKGTPYADAFIGDKHVKRVLEQARNGGQKITKVAIIGSNLSSRGKIYTNSVIVGTYKTGPVGNKVEKHVVLGKVFLGEDEKAKLEQAGKEAFTINRVVGLTGKRKIEHTDSPEVIQKKLFPTTYRLEKRIQATYGNFEEEIPVDKFFKNYSLGAGTINNKSKNEPHISFEQLLKNKNGVQISKVVTIAKEPIGNVAAGKPFVLYSSDSSINLNDPKTVLRLLKTARQNGGKFPNTFSNAKGQEFPINIGILPLDNKNMSFMDVFRRHKNNFFSNKKVALMENTVFEKRTETIKVAKVLGNVMDHFLSSPGLVSGLTKYNGETIVFDAEEAQKLLGSTAIFSKETYTGEEKIPTSGNVSNNDFDNFVKKLNVPKDSKLSNEDILSSIFVPMLRNFRTDVFKVTGGMKYKSSYKYSMFKSYSDSEGKITQEFNIPNMMGNISMELAWRMSQKYGKDEAKAMTEKYMEELIIPALMEMFSKSDMFKQYSITTDTKTNEPLKVKLLNGQIVESSVAFTTETIGDKNIEEGVTSSSDFFIADGGKINHSYLITSAKSISYPGGNFDIGDMANDWYSSGQDADPLEGLYTPTTVVKSYDVETLSKRLSGIRDKALALNDDSTEEEIEEVRQSIEGLQKKITPTLHDFSPHNRMLIRQEASEAINAFVNNDIINDGSNDVLKIDSMSVDINSMFKDFLESASPSTDIPNIRKAIIGKFRELDVDVTTVKYKELQAEYNKILNSLDSKYSADMKVLKSIDESLKGLKERIVAKEDISIEEFDAVKRAVEDAIKISPVMAQNLMDNLSKLAFDSNKYTLKTSEELENHFRNNDDISKPVKDPKVLAAFQGLKDFLTENGFDVSFGDELVINVAKREIVFAVKEDGTVEELSDEMAEALADVMSTMMLGTTMHEDFNAILLKSDAFKSNLKKSLLKYRKTISSTEYSNLRNEKIKDQSTRLFKAAIKDSIQRKFRDEFIEEMPSSFLDKILNFTTSVISFLKDINIDSVNSIIDSKIDDVFNGNYDTFRVEPNEGYIEIDFQEAFNSDAEAHRVQTVLSNDPAIVLTGSIAIAAQGSVYRNENNMVHDLDYSVVGKTRAEIEESFPKLFPDPSSIFLISSFATPANETSTFLVPPEGHKVVNVHKLDARKFNFLKTGENRIFPLEGVDVSDENNGGILHSYDVVDKDGNIVLSYRLEFERNKHGKVVNRKDVFTGNQDLKASPIDLFTNETKPYETTTTSFIDNTGKKINVGLKSFGSVFDAKIDMGRLKDTMDYTNFRPKLSRGVEAAQDTSKLALPPQVDVEAPLTIQLSNGMSLILKDDNKTDLVGPDGKVISDDDVKDGILYQFIPAELEALIDSRSKAVEDYDKAVIENNIKKMLNGGNPVIMNIWAGGKQNAELSNFAERPFDFVIGGHKFKFKNVESAFQAYKVMFNNNLSYFEKELDIEGNETDKVKLDKNGRPILSKEGIAAIEREFTDITGNQARIKRLFFEMDKIGVGKFNKISAKLAEQLMLDSFEANEDAKNLLLNTIDATFTHIFNNNFKDKIWGDAFPEALTNVRTQLLAKKIDAEEAAESIIKTKLSNLPEFSKEEINLIDSVITMKTQVKALEKVIDGKPLNRSDRDIFKMAVKRLLASTSNIKKSAVTKLSLLLMKCK